MAVVLQLLFYNFIGPGLTISLKKKCTELMEINKMDKNKKIKKLK